MTKDDDFIPWFGETSIEPPQALNKLVDIKFRNGVINEKVNANAFRLISVARPTPRYSLPTINPEFATKLLAPQVSI